MGASGLEVSKGKSPGEGTVPTVIGILLIG